MISASPRMPLVVSFLVILAAFIVAGVAFGFVQTLLFVVFPASAAMFCAFIAVASSRNGY